MASKAFFLFTLAAVLNGCAFSKVHEDGSQTHIGFLYLKIPSPEYSQAGTLIETTSVGASGLLTPAGSGISIGYTNERIGVLRNNVAVVLD